MPHRFKGERTLMRIFIGESDKYQGKPLYEALLERLRHKGLAGATVLRGVAGFGASSVVHTDKVLRSEEHTSELQSRLHLVCRLLLEKKKEDDSRLIPTTVS